MLKSVVNIIRFLPFYVKLYMDYKRVLKYTKQLLKEVKPKFQNWDVLIDAENQRRMRGYILIHNKMMSQFSN